MEGQSALDDGDKRKKCKGYECENEEGGFGSHKQYVSGGRRGVSRKFYQGWQEVYIGESSLHVRRFIPPTTTHYSLTFHHQYCMVNFMQESHNLQPNTNPILIFQKIHNCTVSLFLIELESQSNFNRHTLPVYIYHILPRSWQ